MAVVFCSVVWDFSQPLSPRLILNTVQIHGSEVRMKTEKGREADSKRHLSEHQDTRQVTVLSLFLPRQLWRCFHMASAQSIFFFHSPFQCIKRAVPWNSIWGVEMIKNLPRLGPQWLRVHSGKWTTCRPRKLKNIDKLRTVSTAAVQETRKTFSSLLKYFTELSFKKNK